jgi:hypothetical protein
VTEDQKGVLKKCPWCGRRPNVGKGCRRKADNLYQKAGEWMWNPFVKCGYSACRVSPQIEGDSVEEVIEIWNTRKAE